MRRFLVCVAAIVAAVSCAETSKEPVQALLGEYATVEIGKENTPFLQGITDNGKEVLNLYRFAAMEVDNIYWKQVFGDKSELEAIADGPVKNYAMINYGPWDRITGKTFVEGYGQRPAGLRFYPEDMTAEEFAAFDDPQKNSPYTIIKRAEDGSLKCVWYHDEYKENIEKICNYLRAAADITIIPSVKDYLLQKAEDLQVDDYYKSSMKWLDMGSKMDLVIGPCETKDDELLGIKRSYSAYVVLNDLARSAALAKFSAQVPEYQKTLPVATSESAFTPGATSDILVCDALYYAGNANAGIKDIAINLPFDTAVQTEKGTRTILMQNVINSKFNLIVKPLADLLLSDDDKTHVDDEAFFWLVAFRELSHAVGVRTTQDGRDVEEALGNLAAVIEDAKADVLGAQFAINAIGSYETGGIVTPEDAVATFVAGLIRSARFGNEFVGRSALICYNYMRENGAFSQHPDSRFYIDYTAARKAIADLSAELLSIQTVGDYAAASDFVKKYSAQGEELSSAAMLLRTENIPIDVTFKFVW